MSEKYTQSPPKYKLDRLLRPLKHTWRLNSFILYMRARSTYSFLLWKVRGIFRPPGTIGTYLSSEPWPSKHVSGITCKVDRNMTYSLTKQRAVPTTKDSTKQMSDARLLAVQTILAIFWLSHPSLPFYSIPPSSFSHIYFVIKGQLIRKKNYSSLQHHIALLMSVLYF